MSGLKDPRRMAPAARRRLVARFAKRPWPPPPEHELDALFATAARRILQDLADDPPPGFPHCEDWIVIVPEPRAPALRSAAVDGRLLVAGTQQWGELDEATRGAALREAALLRLDSAGDSPPAWRGRLPAEAPSAADLAATLGADAPAVTARLSAPGFAELELLHVFARGADGPVHAPDLSGIVALRELP